MEYHHYNLQKKGNLVVFIHPQCRTKVGDACNLICPTKRNLFMQFLQIPMALVKHWNEKEEEMKRFQEEGPRRFPYGPHGVSLVILQWNWFITERHIFIFFFYGLLKSHLRASCLGKWVQLLLLARPSVSWKQRDKWVSSFGRFLLFFTRDETLESCPLPGTAKDIC